MGFHVLLEDPEVLGERTSEVSRIVAKALGVPLPDVAQRVRYGGGIVARDLADDVAKAVIEALDAKKLGAFVVPSAPAVTLPRPRRFSGLVLTADGLEGLVRGSTKREKLPWSRVKAIHVTAVARELTQEEEDEGHVPRSMSDVKNLPEEVRRLSGDLDFWEDRERRRVELCLEVVADDAVLVGRVFAEDADYSQLEGKIDSSLGNFMTLVRAIVAKAPSPSNGGSVVIPPASRRFAASADWKGVLFDKPEARDAFNLWLLLAARAGRAFPHAHPEQVDEVADEDVEDPEEALEVADGDHADAEDAPDEDDDSVLDEDEEDEDEEDERDPEREGSSEENLAAAGGDEEIAKTLELFDQTRRLRKSDVLDALAAQAKAAEGEEPKMTGAWDVNQLLHEANDLEGKDLTTGRFDVQDILKDVPPEKKD